MRIPLIVGSTKWRENCTAYLRINGMEMTRDWDLRFDSNSLLELRVVIVRSFSNPTALLLFFEVNEELQDGGVNFGWLFLLCPMT